MLAKAASPVRVTLKIFKIPPLLPIESPDPNMLKLEDLIPVSRSADSWGIPSGVEFLIQGKHGNDGGALRGLRIRDD